MTEIFEKLRKIAEEEFGCTLVQGEEKIDFKSIFGFGIEEIEDFDGIMSIPTTDVAMYLPVETQFKNQKMEAFECDYNAANSICIAA